MPKLALKLKNGVIIEGNAPMHFMLAESRGIAFENIIDVGIYTKGRLVWCNRKPH